MGIFDFLNNLFRRKVQPQPSPTRPSDPLRITIQGATPPWPEPPKPTRFSEGAPLKELLNQVKGKGHPQYPFLHQEYSPNSRIPCADFTSFIIERLGAGDVASISALMRGIIEANPGLGTDGEWISERVEDVLRAPLERYLTFADPAAYLQLRAMWIIAEKEGGGREFWLTRSHPSFFARALSPHEIEIKPAIDELRKKANRFIREMRKDTPYWLDVPLFKASDLKILPLPERECVEKVRRLSIGARLHLFTAAWSGSGILPRLTGYDLRCYGLYIPDSSQEIIESGLLSLLQDSRVLKNSIQKSELIEACDKWGVTYKKSWNKEKLLNALEDSSPEHIKKLMEDLKPVTVNPNYADCLQVLMARAQQLELVFKVLCFI